MATVLVVEDDPDLRELERLTLDLSGYCVITATNGQEALQTLTRCRPCVILLDLMMPVMDGFTFLQERTRQHLAEDVPVVCVSAGGTAMLSKAMQLGAGLCLSKPAGVDDIAATVGLYCRASPDA